MPERVFGQARWGKLKDTAEKFDIEHATPPDMPAIDVEYASRGQPVNHLASAGDRWTTTKDGEAITGRDPHAYVAAVSRLAGPIKRAWEYPYLMQAMKEDPKAYLKHAMAAVTTPGLSTNNIDDHVFQDILNEDCEFPYNGKKMTIGDLLALINPKASDQEVANAVLRLLVEMEDRYINFAGDCK